MLDFFSQFEIFTIEFLKPLVERGAASARFISINECGLLSFDGEDFGADLIRASLYLKRMSDVTFSRCRHNSKWC